MTIWQAIVLGIVQGLTEFLPVSSSGHLELFRVLLGVELEENLTFTVILHGATVLSTICALWREIWQLIKGFFRFRWNEETQYIVKILISMIPIGLVGLFFRDQVESLFSGNILLVGSMLLLTGILLYVSSRAEMRDESTSAPSYLSALIMGIGQAFAALPGLSRSGTTISLGILSGTSRASAARFSFLMVLPPIIGMNLLDMLGGGYRIEAGQGAAYALGALVAFITGYIACRAMLTLVRRKGLRVFALYCLCVGIVAVAAHFMF